MISNEISSMRRVIFFLIFFTLLITACLAQEVPIPEPIISPGFTPTPAQTLILTSTAVQTITSNRQITQDKGNELFKLKPTITYIEDENEIIQKNALIGIWQANDFMASGWSDRYHFYSNGNYHFYPNQMICKPVEEELMGSWRIEEGLLKMTITSKIEVINLCDQRGFKSEISKIKVDLEQAQNITLHLILLDMSENDFYPSIMLDDQRYWKFSDDPTVYGWEEFSQE